MATNAMRRSIEQERFRTNSTQQELEKEYLGTIDDEKAILEAKLDESEIYIDENDGLARTLQ